MSDATQKITGGFGPQGKADAILLNGVHPDSYGPQPVPDHVASPDGARILSDGWITGSDSTVANSLGRVGKGKVPPGPPPEGSKPTRTTWQQVARQRVTWIVKSLRRGRLDVRMRPDGFDYIDSQKGLLARLTHDDADRLQGVLEDPLFKRIYQDELETAVNMVLSALRSFD